MFSKTEIFRLFFQCDPIFSIGTFPCEFVLRLVISQSKAGLALIHYCDLEHPETVSDLEHPETVT